MFQIVDVGSIVAAAVIGLSALIADFAFRHSTKAGLSVLGVGVAIAGVTDFVMEGS